MCIRDRVMTWLDDADESNGGYPAGTVVARYVKGDGRTSDFRAINKAVNPSDPVAWATAQLGELRDGS